MDLIWGIFKNNITSSSGPMVQWFKTSPLHGEDPEFEPRLDQALFFFVSQSAPSVKASRKDISSSLFKRKSFLIRSILLSSPFVRLY